MSGAASPEPVPSKPRKQNQTCRNTSNTETFETLGTEPSEPATLRPRVRNPVPEPIRETMLPETDPGTLAIPPEPWFFLEPPQLAQCVKWPNSLPYIHGQIPSVSQISTLDLPCSFPSFFNMPERIFAFVTLVQVFM